MGFPEYADHDGLGLAELVRRKEVTPAELIEAAIERIERHNPVLNAVVYKAYDEARRTAGGRLSDGPFTGVPFLVKDLGCPVGGWPRTSGSRFTKAEVPAADGALTRRLREAHQPDSRLGGRRAREGGRSQVQHLTLGLTAAPPAGERRPAPPCAPSRVRRRARLR